MTDPNATPLFGFLLVDKPGGWTSHDVVAKVRGMARIKKVGHAGTLDPMATGLLVLAVGRATRLLRYIQAQRKVYVAEAMLGVTTDTLDADGAILGREPMPVSQTDVQAVMRRFVGDIMQTPPMVSARRVDGRRLYELAREGKEVDRPSQHVTIHRLELRDFSPSEYPTLEFLVECSTGTYVRTLADDIGRALGGGAHLTALRRLSIGALSVDRAHSIEALQAATDAEALAGAVLDPAPALGELVHVEVDEKLEQAVRHGMTISRSSLSVAAEDGAPVVLLDQGRRVLAVYRVEGGKAAPEVVVA